MRRRTILLIHATWVVTSLMMLGLLILPQAWTWAPRYFAAFHFATSITLLVYAITLLYGLRGVPPATVAGAAGRCLAAGVVTATTVLVPVLLFVRCRTWVDPHLGLQLPAIAFATVLCAWCSGAALRRLWADALLAARSVIALFRLPGFTTPADAHTTITRKRDRALLRFITVAAACLILHLDRAAQWYRATWYDGVWFLPGFDAVNTHDLEYVQAILIGVLIALPLCLEGWRRRRVLLLLLAVAVVPILLEINFRE